MNSRSVVCHSAGFSLVEVMIATAVLAIGFGAIMTVNSQVLRFARDTRHTNAASLMLQARVEQMRNMSWDKMTKASYLQDSILSEARQAGSGIPGSEVQIKVSAYDPNNLTASSAIQPIIVKRAADGTTSIQQTGGSLDGMRLARVDVAVSWPGANGRVRSRESSTIISNNGISKNYVPVMGTFAGGAFDDDEGSILTPIIKATTPLIDTITDPVTDTDEKTKKDKSGNAGTPSGKPGHN